MFQRADSENQLGLNLPYLMQSTLIANGTQPALLLRDGFPSNPLGPANVNYQLTHIRAVDPNSPARYIQYWSLGVQRSLPAQFVLTMDHEGTKSTHLDLIHDLNQYVNNVKPCPNYAYLGYPTIRRERLLPLEASVQHRFQSGLPMNVAYT